MYVSWKFGFWSVRWKVVDPVTFRVRSNIIKNIHDPFFIEVILASLQTALDKFKFLARTDCDSKTKHSMGLGIDTQEEIKR